MFLFMRFAVVRKWPYRKYVLQAIFSLLLFQNDFANVKTWTGSAGDGL